MFDTAWYCLSNYVHLFVKMRLAAGAAVVGVLLAGCNGTDDSGDNPPTSPPSTSPVITVVPTISVTPRPTTTSTPTRTPTATPTPTPTERRATAKPVPKKTTSAVVPPPAPEPPSADVYYPNCAAARAAGVTPIMEGQPGYRSGLDRNHDGEACE